jgi:hypothetical protein
MNRLMVKPMPHSSAAPWSRRQPTPSGRDASPSRTAIQLMPARCGARMERYVAAARRRHDTHRPTDVANRSAVTAHKAVGSESPAVPMEDWQRAEAQRIRLPAASSAPD